VWKEAALLYFNFIVLADTNFNLESDKSRTEPIAPNLPWSGDCWRHSIIAIANLRRCELA